jgi:hypothetical protein
MNCVHRTGRQTVAQSVTVIVSNEAGLVVNHDDGAFMAGFGAGTASVAAFFVNVDNAS